MNRAEFAEQWGDLAKPDSPLWIAEQRLGQQCESFLYLQWHPASHFNYPYGPKCGWRDFWLWCERNLRGQAACFSWGEVGSWWGLTDQSDTMLFVLRWS